MDSTKLLYLDDFDVVEATARVIDVIIDDDTLSIILDQTCFYPKGGGQDYDQGVIRSDDGRQFAVQEVYLDQDGVVSHVGSWTSGELKVGDLVNLRVDTARRLTNTRLHSAGHVIDMALDALGYDWVPGKGAHYPYMSNVEYSSDTYNADQKDDYLNAIQNKVDELIASGGESHIKFMTVEQMSAICRHVPDNIPANKPSRIVVYGADFGVPCGGTHVADLSYVGSVKITKIKKKSGAIRVSYSLA